VVAVKVINILILLDEMHFGLVRRGLRFRTQYCRNYCSNVFAVSFQRKSPVLPSSTFRLSELGPGDQNRDRKISFRVDNFCVFCLE